MSLITDIHIPDKNNCSFILNLGKCYTIKDSLIIYLIIYYSNIKVLNFHNRYLKSNKIIYKKKKIFYVHYA